MQDQLSGEPLRVRVITPELARSIANPNKVAALPSNALTLKSTLHELKAAVEKHLGLPASPDHDQLECNCSLARLIDREASIRDSVLEGCSSLCKLVSIHGCSVVTCIQVPVCSEAQLVEQARQHLGSLVVGKTYHVIGGTSASDGEYVPFAIEFEWC